MHNQTIGSIVMNLSAVEPLDRATIKQATEQIHKAVQWIARVGNAHVDPVGYNLPGNLHWDINKQYFYGYPFFDKAIRLAFRPSDFTWLILDRSFSIQDALMGLDSSDERVWSWLQQHLFELGLDTAKLKYDLPYTLPYQHHITSRYTVHNKEALSIFSKLRTAGIQIIKSALLFSGLTDKAQKIKTWPHHLDVCSYIPFSSGADTTDHISISLGMAIHDPTIYEQYLYISYELPGGELFSGNSPQLPFGGYWISKNGWNAAVLRMSAITEGNSVQLDKGVLFMIGVVEILIELLNQKKLFSRGLCETPVSS